MPQYVVTTDEGKFKVTLDKEPSSPEELMGLVQGQLQGQPASAAPSSSSKGFLGTMAHEATEGWKQMTSQHPVGGLAQTGNVAMGLLRALGAPLAGAGQAVEDITKPYLPELPVRGAMRSPSEALNLATQTIAAPKAAGKAVEMVGSRLLAPNAAKYGQQAAKVVALENEFSIPTTAAQRTGSSGLSQAEAIPTRFPLGVQPVQEFGKRQEVAARTAIEKVGQGISPEKLTPVQAGEVLKKQYAVASDVARKSATEAYDAVKTAVPEDATFETVGLLKAAQEVHREATVAKGIIKTKPEGIAARVEAAVRPPTKELPSSIEEFSKDIPSDLLNILKAKYGALDNPDRLMTFEGMDFLRKDLRDMLRVAKRSGKDNEVRQLGKILDGLTDDMRQTAAQFPEAFGLLEHADKKFANEVAPYFTKGKFPRVLSEQDASQVTKRLIWGNRDNPEHIELVKKAIDNPQEFSKVVGSWWEDIFQKSIDPKTETFSSQRWLTNWNRFTPEVKQSLLGSDNAAKAERLSDLFESIGRANTMGVNPSQTSRGILGATQGFGAIKLVGDLAVGNLPAVVRDGTLLLSPYALGRILMSKTGIDLLSVGFNLPPGTREATEVATRLIGLANSMPEKTRNLLLSSDQITLDEKIMGAMGAERPK